MNREIVYVVDDDEAVRDSLRWLLEGNGFTVKVFESAEKLLENTKQKRQKLHGCLILDVRMPGMTGIELHDELIKNDFNLIRCSKLAILSNSTFSWWASFLSNSKKEFIVPSNFSIKEKRIILPSETILN